MTVLPEARLAREAEICYASIACITDYDSWHETKDTVSVETIVTTMRHNIDLAKKTIKLAAGRLPQKRNCYCVNALGPAIVTDLSLASPQEKKKLDLLIGEYVKKE
jgi:5'-methylthioadenosine phosphorylase